jgi:hypothetical protein
MRHFTVILLALTPASPAFASEAESAEVFELAQPRTHVLLELHADGTADFNREFKDESGGISVFRSGSGTWTRCGNGSNRLSRIKPILESTHCFIVEVDGADERGEARLGMMFTRDGDTLEQVREDGPALVLKRKPPLQE